MDNPAFALNRVDYAVDHKTILRDLTLSVPEAAVTAIIGPNGSGKSTLLSLLSGLNTPGLGELNILGKPVQNWKRKLLARELAMVPQFSPVPAGMSVVDLVRCGRYPWVGSFGRMGKKDHAAVDEAIERTGLSDLANRDLMQLSGGERQRAWLAVALAQQTRVLLLDEPTSWLDIAHQLRLIEIVQTLNKDKGTTVVWVLHDLNQAAEYSDQLVVMKEGQLVCQGDASQVLDARLLKDVFNVHAVQARDTQCGTSLWVPVLEQPPVSLAGAGRLAS